MAPFTASVVSFLLVAPLLVSAAPSNVLLPRHIAGLPRDAAHLALDEDAREIIAFSQTGANLGRFPINLGSRLAERQATGACATMSSDDVQKRASTLTLSIFQQRSDDFALLVPGWKILKDAAESNWGNGKYNVVTNDKDVRSFNHLSALYINFSFSLPTNPPRVAQAPMPLTLSPMVYSTCIIDIRY
jgi:hypothetical protein